ncbi:hypothetical protein CER22_27230 [Bacillus sp. K2I17]|nr:hypothetical protein CER22_27230 [Bacillus sp. K2I17]
MSRNHKVCKNYHVVTKFLWKFQLWVLIGESPHHHRLKKSKRTQNEKTADFLLKVTNCRERKFSFWGHFKMLA